MAAPELLSIALKEHGVQLFAEGIDVEIFQIVVGPLVDAGRQIAEAHLHGGGEAHGLQRFPLEADGIVKKVMLIIDAADPVAGKHDPVFLLRVGTAGGQGHLPVQKTVVHGGCALQGHHVRPPLHHPLVLAEKAVPADVHPIVPVADGLGNTADLLTALQHGHVVFTGFQKLVGGGQSRGARADDEYLFHMRIPRFVIR